MRHAFAFPPEVRTAVRRHVYGAYSSVSPIRYEQEPAWVAAFARALEGTAYDGPHGSVIITSTVFNDRGRNSAEKRFGADMAITATVSDAARTIDKAVLLQAKLGHVNDLPPRESERLREQVRKMQQLTRFPKILEVPGEDGFRRPRVLSGARLAAGQPTRGLLLEDYFTQRLLTTLDGDTRGWFVAAVQESGLTQVRVSAIRNTSRARTTQRSLFE